MWNKPLKTLRPPVPKARGRGPVQEGSRERVLVILNEMEKLISEGDLDQISISQIAKTTGQSRTSLYRFVPTVSTIYKELGLRYMAEMEAHVRGCWPVHPPRMMHGFSAAQVSRPQPIEL